MKAVRAVVLLFVLLAFVAAAVPDGVVRFPQSYPLEDAQRAWVNGKVVRGTCQHPSRSITLKPGQEAVEERELARDTRRCRFLLERGVPPDRTLGQPDVAPEPSDAYSQGVGS
jgi:hypothetical protein